MSKPAHTPGPWRVDPRAKCRVMAGEDDMIATTICQADLRDQHEANAIIAAAAPEMYGRLESCNIDLRLLLDDIRNGARDTDSALLRIEDIIRRNEAAIAKAEGRG